MKNIFIGFSRPNKFKIGSFLIRIIECVDYSHVFLMIDYEIHQQSIPGINVVGVSEFMEHNYIIDCDIICVTDDQHKEIVKFCNECMNYRIPYGRVQIIGMGFVRIINQLFKTRFKNPFADGMKTMVCSEFVGRVLSIIGIDIPQDQLEIEGPKYLRKFIKERIAKTRN